MLRRAEEVHGAIQARSFASLVAVSRNGWRESDFRSLLPRLTNGDWGDLRFAAVRRAFRAHLIQRGSHGEWDFAHTQMRAAVFRHYLPDTGRLRELHLILGDHLLDLPANDPLRQNEAMFHLIGADDRDRAAAFCAGLADPSDAGAPALRTLAERLLAMEDPEPGEGIQWASSLLVQPDLGPRQILQICKALQEGVNKILSFGGHVGIRLQLFQAARHVLSEIGKRDAANRDAFRALRDNHIWAADLLRAQGREREALDDNLAGMAIEKDLAGHDSAQVPWRWLLSKALKRACLRSADLRWTSAMFRATLPVWEAEAKREPNNPTLQVGLAELHDSIGDTAVKRGNHVEALASYRASLTITQQLAERHPTNEDWQWNLAISRQKLGDGLLAEMRADDALSLYKAALETLQCLVRRNPDHAEWQRDRSVMLDRVGNVLSSQANFGDALSFYRESLRIRERLTTKDPANVIWLRDLSVSHEKVGDVLAAQHRAAEALDAFDASLAIRTRLTTRDSVYAEWQRDLAVTYNKIGDVFASQGIPLMAENSYRASLAIREQLAAAQGNDATRQRDLWVCYDKLARALYSQGDAECRMWWQRAYDVIVGMKRRRWFMSPADEALFRDIEARLRRLTGHHVAATLKY